MASRFFTKTIIFLTSLVLMFTVVFAPTSTSALGNAEARAAIPDLTAFTNSLENGQADVLRGLYVKNLMALQIVQQPANNDGFVTSAHGYATEFRMAAKYGNIGMLAHNYLAGQSFFQLSPGQEIHLIYGDKKTEAFVVTYIQQYQALSPDSPTSDFIDLSSGERLTASSLFSKIYANGSGNLVLQTCIHANQNPTWGRLFVIARPVNQVYAYSN
jgi:hypothetical protein